MRRLLTTLALLIVTATPLFAQGGSTNVRATDPVTGTIVQVGDSTNNAVRVSLIATGPALSLPPVYLEGDAWSQPGAGLVVMVKTGDNTIAPITLDENGGIPVSFLGGFINVRGSINLDTVEPFNDDFNTSGGTSMRSGFGILLPTSSGPVIGGTSSAPLRTDPTGTTTQPVSLASVPSHAVTNAGTFVVQENGAALTALQLIDNLPNTQGSTTSGQSGLLIMGAVATAAPTYTNGQTSPISMTTGGLVRVAIEAGGGSGGTSSTIGSAFPATATAVGGSDGTNMQGLRVYDADTDAGTFYSQWASPCKGTTAGCVEYGTSTDPLNVVFAATPTVTIGTFPDNEPFDVARWGGTTVVTGGTNGTVAVGGIQAADAAISGNNPVLMAGFGSSTLPTAMSANGDVTRPWLTLNGTVNTTPRDTAGDSIADATLDAMKVTNSTAATATSYLTVRVSDGTNFATGGTDYTHDSALTVATTAGPMMTCRTSAAEPTNVSADDDAVLCWALRSGAIATTLRDSSGDDVTDAANDAIRVNIVAGAGSGGTAMSDDAAFTVATTSFTPVGGTYKSTRDAVDDNDGGAFAMNAKRGQYVSLETPNSDSVADDTLDTIKVSQATAANLNATVVGTGTFVVQANPGTAANWGVYVEDAGETAGGNLVMAGTVRRDTPASSAGSTTDNAALTTSALGALYVQPIAGASGGATPIAFASTASTNATNIKASAGTLYGISLVNTTTTVYYLRLYNASGTPTCSSATGYVATIPIPPATAAGAAGGIVSNLNVGRAFSTGIAYCFTGGAASTDNTNAATGVYGVFDYL